ncbi:MAG: D-alanine--D-alanine ligase A, partial [Clostridia bacterium]
MEKIKIGVIFGGQSTEHEVSIVSATSVIKNLNKNKYEIEPIYIGKDGSWYNYTKPVDRIEILNIGEEPQELEKIENVFEKLKKLDIVFPVLHGLYGEDGTIQGLLELLKIPYVGCKVLASSICMDKIYTKAIFEKAKLKQAKYITVYAEKNTYIYIDSEFNHTEKTIEEIISITEKELKYPVFVKPSNSGSSVGVNKATNK